MRLSQHLAAGIASAQQPRWSAQPLTDSIFDFLRYQRTAIPTALRRNCSQLTKTAPASSLVPLLLIVEIADPAHPQLALAEPRFFAGSPPLPSSPRHCPTPQGESPTAPKAGLASQEESFASATGEPPSH